MSYYSLLTYKDADKESVDRHIGFYLYATHFNLSSFKIVFIFHLCHCNYNMFWCGPLWFTFFGTLIFWSWMSVSFPWSR